MKTFSKLFVLILMCTAFSSAKAQNPVDFEIRETKVIGQELHIELLMTNQSESPKLTMALGKAKLYDNTGKEFTAARIHIADQFKEFASISHDCPKGIPLTVKIVFKEGAANLELIPHLQFTVVFQGVADGYNAKFENIEIPISDNEKVLKAHNFSDYFETHAGVFLELKSVSKNEKMVQVDFLVENTDYDKKVNFNFQGTRLIDEMGNEAKLKAMQMGDEHKTYGGISKQLPQNVPVKFTLFFELPDAAAQEIAILELATQGNFFQLRNMTL